MELEVKGGGPVLEPDLWKRLPSELLLNILGKLPVRSLWLFRSVCRDWKMRIDDGQVVDDGRPEKSVIFYGHFVHRSWKETAEPDIVVSEPCLLFPNSRRSTWESHVGGFLGRHNLPVDASFLVAADGGLLCYACFGCKLESDTLVIFNPLTETLRVLPLPSPIFPRDPFYDEEYTYGEICSYALVGMNVDQETGNYKLVVAGLEDNSSRKTQIYESGKKRWRSLGQVPPISLSRSHEFWTADRGIGCCGNLYWHVRREDWITIHGLLKFDLDSESWTFVRESVPSSLADLHIATHHGRILLMSFARWKVEEYPEETREARDLLKLGPEVRLVNCDMFMNLVDGYKPIRGISQGSPLYIVYEYTIQGEDSPDQRKCLLYRIINYDTSQVLPEINVWETWETTNIVVGDKTLFCATAPSLKAKV